MQDPPRAKEPPHDTLGQAGALLHQLKHQARLIRAGDAGDRPDLRIGQPPRGHLGRQPRMRSQRAGDPHMTGGGIKRRDLQLCD